jgi:multiple sugar transport system permease protein
MTPPANVTDLNQEPRVAKWATPLGGRIRKRARGTLEAAAIYTLVAILLVAILAPYLWMFLSSISPQRELAAAPPHWFPEEPSFWRYLSLVYGPPPGNTVMQDAARKFPASLQCSLIVASATTAFCLVVGSAAAYALVRLPVPGKNRFLLSMLAAQMLPVMVVIIPLFLMAQAVHLNDTYTGLIVVYSGMMLPTVIWIMHSYFQTVPVELEEAAMIDGATRIGSLWKVVLPVCGPGLVATAAFTFLSSWNEFFVALIFAGTHAKTITVLVAEFSSQFGIDYGLMATGGIVGSIPPIILAFLLQRYIVAGLTAGSLKG